MEFDGKGGWRGWTRERTCLCGALGGGFNVLGRVVISCAAAAGFEVGF